MKFIYTLRINKAFLLFLALICPLAIMAESGSPHSGSTNVTLASDYLYINENWYGKIKAYIELWGGVMIVRLKSREGSADENCAKIYIWHPIIAGKDRFSISICAAWCIKLPWLL